MAITLGQLLAVGHRNDDVTHGVGTVYFPRKFSHKQWVLHFGCLSSEMKNRPRVDFVGGSSNYGKKILLQCWWYH